MKKTALVVVILIATILLISPKSYALNYSLGQDLADIREEQVKSSQKSHADILNELIEYRSILEIRTIVNEVFRNIKKSILTLLYELTNSVENSFYKVVNYLDIINGSAAFRDLEGRLKPVVLSLLVLGLSFSMIFLMFSGASTERKDSLKNLVVIVLLFVSLPVITNILVETTKTITTDIPDHFGLAEGNVSSITESLFTNAFHDVLKARDSNFPIPKDLESLKIDKNADYIMTMNINEIIELKDAKSEVLKHELRGDGVLAFEEAGFLSRQTGLDAFSPAYYRWSINFILPFASIVILLFVYLFASIRTARVILDLAVNRIFVLLASPFYVGDIRKVKEILNQLFIGYLQIFGVAFTVAMFGLFITLVNNSAMNTYLKLIFYIGGGFGVIDGAKFFENIFGTDVGINSQRAIFGAFISPVRSAREVATSPIRSYQTVRRSSDDKMTRLAQRASRTQQYGTSSKREQKKILKQLSKKPKSMEEREASTNKVKTNSKLAGSFEANRNIGSAIGNSRVSDTKDNSNTTHKNHYTNKDPISQKLSENLDRGDRSDE